MQHSSHCVVVVALAEKVILTRICAQTHTHTHTRCYTRCFKDIATAGTGSVDAEVVQLIYPFCAARIHWSKKRSWPPQCSYICRPVNRPYDQSLPTIAFPDKAYSLKFDHFVVGFFNSARKKPTTHQKPPLQPTCSSGFVDAQVSPLAVCKPKKTSKTLYHWRSLAFQSRNHKGGSFLWMVWEGNEIPMATTRVYVWPHELVMLFFVRYSLEVPPHTGCNRHHQDYEPFLVGNPELNLHLWLASWVILGGG